MNILFVSEHAVHFGGIGAVIQQLCRGLQARGHRCYLYTMYPVPPQLHGLCFDGVEAGPLAAPARLTDITQRIANRRAFAAMAAAIGRWNIELVHCHEIHRSLFTAGRCAPCPIVASSHGGVFHKRYAKKRVVRDYRAIAARVSCVTVLNAAMAQCMHERFGDLFHTVTIPNGIEDDWLATPGEGAKDILLCAGRLSADKCYELAVAGYAGSTSRQHYPLVIIGEGENEQAIIDQAQRQQIDIVKELPPSTRANTLYLAGYRSGEEKRQLFARARLFLHPSRFEAFGIVLLEAMAQGAMPLCAELATYRSQFPAPPFELHYVSEAQASAWTSAIDNAIASPQLEQHCSDNRKAVANFAWSRIFEQYMDCYQMALAPRKPDALQ